MIDLTPLEVRQKKGDFRRAFRGYDAELVNDFLDLVADRMEELVKENMALSDAVESLEQELADYRDKEAALSDALMAAQKLREDARSHAEKESELMLREAKAAAEEARQQAAQSLAREEETLRQVRARRAQLVESFRRLLERELGELAVIEESLELNADAERAEDRRAAGREPEEGGEAESSRGMETGVRRTSAMVDEVEAEASGTAETGETAEGETSEGETSEDREGGEAAPEGDSRGDVQEDWLQSLTE